MGSIAAREFFISHYLTVAFMASLGVIQLAAARGSLRGLWLARNRRMVRGLGLVLLIVAAGVYYLAPLWVEGPWADAEDSIARSWHTVDLGDLSAAHNVGDTNGGLSGNTQAILLLAACSASFILCALVGLVLRRRKGERSSRSQSGLETLEKGTIVDAIATAYSLLRTGSDPDAAQDSASHSPTEATD